MAGFNLEVMGDACPGGTPICSAGEGLPGLLQREVAKADVSDGGDGTGPLRSIYIRCMEDDIYSSPTSGNDEGNRVCYGSVEELYKGFLQGAVGTGRWVELSVCRPQKFWYGHWKRRDFQQICRVPEPGVPIQWGCSARSWLPPKCMLVN